MTHDASKPSIGDSAVFSADLEASRDHGTQAGLFFKKFLQKGRGISAATPSSRFLSEAVCSAVDFDRPGTIVELGAGTGPITEVILDRLRSHHRFVAVEADPDFSDVFRSRFPGIDLIEGDATDIENPLLNLGITKVDYVLSGLPTPNLPRRSLMRMIRWMERAMTPHGEFAQITVIPHYYKPFYRRLFQHVEYQPVWLNAPPGGVFHCRSVRPRGSFQSR